MGLFDFLKPKKRTLYDRMMEDPAVQQQQEIFNLQSKMCAGGCETDELPNASGEFGHTATNPIPTKTVFGSTVYLARLRAPDGAKVVYKRRCSLSCEVSNRPIDAYDIFHPDGRHLTTLYVSPYQLRNSHKAPSGLHLIEPPPT